MHFKYFNGIFNSIDITDLLGEASIQTNGSAQKHREMPMSQTGIVDQGYFQEPKIWQHIFLRCIVLKLYVDRLFSMPFFVEPC